MRRNDERFVGMSRGEWHHVCMRMVWALRTGQDHYAPDSVLAMFAGRVPDAEEWKALRERVTLKRRTARRTEEYYRKQRAKQHRREYLRSYMRSWRAKHQPPRDV
jgi:hypothetical protein